MSARATIAVVTGTRAEFGLLRSTMRAVRAHDGLTLRVIAAGSHFLPPAETWREVDAEFGIDARVEMQRADEPRDRTHDALALGRGVEGFARALEQVGAHCAVVLGDRIEAFAAASAASVMGVLVAHVHGGDRAEGVADEAMRHAITKLAHLHFPATPLSAERIVRMGEPPERVRVVGSPAVDGLADIAPLPDDEYARLGSPTVLFCLHPVGRDDEEEARDARAAIEGLTGERALALMPNFDAGREGITCALRDAERAGILRVAEHLPRERFAALCLRAALEGGVIVGNSSAGLIECSALRPALPCVNIGPRQAGRERPASVVDVERGAPGAVREAVAAARSIDRWAVRHPYGDGRAGERIAAVLADTALARGSDRAAFVRKHNTF